jgi:hypothetical protein
MLAMNKLINKMNYLQTRLEMLAINKLINKMNYLQTRLERPEDRTLAYLLPFV